MKLSFVLSVLASMAVLSLAVPLVAIDGEEAMLQALSATLEAQGGNAASADAESTVDVETAVTSSRLVRFITVVMLRRTGWMAFAWLACYDNYGQNVCAGKPATASADMRGRKSWEGCLTASPIYGKDGDCFYSGAQDAGQTFRVNLEKDYDIRSIKLAAAQSRCSHGYSCSEGLTITMYDKTGVEVKTSTPMTTTREGMQTFNVAEAALPNKHGEHLSPVVELLNGLKAKLLKAQKTSQNDAKVSKDNADATAAAAAKAAEAAKRAADVATGISTATAKADKETFDSTQRELEMLEKILTMIHTLSGK